MVSAIAVAEDFHDDPGRDPLGKQQACRGMTQIVQGVAARSAAPTFDPASTHKDHGACEKDGAEQEYGWARRQRSSSLRPERVID
jgi:hypothetical protein